MRWADDLYCMPAKDMLGVYCFPPIRIRVVTCSCPCLVSSMRMRFSNDYRLLRSVPERDCAVRCLRSRESVRWSQFAAESVRLLGARWEWLPGAYPGFLSWGLEASEASLKGARRVKVKVEVKVHGFT